MGRDVEIDILANDKTDRGTNSAIRNFEDLKRKVSKATDAVAKSVGPDLAKKFAPIGAMLIKPLALGVAAGAPAIAAAITSAAALGAGGAILAIGAMALKENAKLQKQFEKTTSAIKKRFADAAKPLVGPFLNALKSVERLTKDIAPDFRDMFKALAPIVPLMTQAFSGTIKQVVSALKDSMPGVTAAFKGLASALPTVGKWIGEFIRTLLGNPAVIENTTRALTLLAAGPLKILGPLLSGLNVLFGAQVNMMRLYQIAGGQLWPKLVAWFDGGSGAVTRLKAAFGPLWQAIQNVWNKLKEFAGAKTDKEIVAKFANLVVAVKQTWGPLKTFLGTVWNEAWAFVIRKWNDTVVPWWNGTAKPWLQNQLAGAMDAIFKMAVDKAVGWLKKLPGRAWDAIKGTPGRLLALVGSMAAAGVSNAKSFINGLVNSLRTVVGRAWSAVSGLPGRLAGLVGALARTGSSIGNAFVRAVVSAVSSGAGQIAGAIRSAISNAKNSLPGPARAIATSLGFGGGSSWRPAQVAAQFASGGSFAMAGGGRSRTGGPVQVNQALTVSLDGAPFYAFTASAISESERRTAWRNKVGRR